MNKNIVVPLVAVIIVIFAVFLYVADNSSQTTVSETNLSYDSNHAIQSMLEKNGILMSNPIKIHGESVDEYCTLFSDVAIQNSIRYCTSTEIVDTEDNFVGNIHMVGDEDSPFAVLGIAQTDSPMSELDTIKLITTAMVESIVCECWNDEKPGGFESVSDWVEAAKIHHLDAKQTNSKSEISNLAKKHLLIEISTNPDGFLWKFLVTS